MAYFQPRKRIYTGQIELGPQPRTWIKKHRSFASRDWIESQIRYGEWTKERNEQSSFLVYATNIDGIKPEDVMVCENCGTPRDYAGDSGDNRD